MNVWSVAAVIVALIAPLLVPPWLAVLLVFICSVIVPPMGLVAGILSDALYHTPAVALPYATLVGAFLTLAGYGMQRLIKTRIMGA